eukprot:TRINITY_DN1674_c1_g1_i1.p1 TRINITY_DN1674_c1_g1~~TRINITY_DN1674_c1_g1_i1.p1  ORF type:complete len:442 (-),score=164.66 TRINITY_DN1674_c1_g1_i1:59-1384(-)
MDNKDVLENNEETREISATDHLNKHLLSHFQMALEKGEFKFPEENNEKGDDSWDDEDELFNKNLKEELKEEELKEVKEKINENSKEISTINEEEESESDEDKPKKPKVKRDPKDLITFQEIERAQKILEKSTIKIVKTPVLYNCEDMSEQLKSIGANIHFKLESLQNCGSYKIRGIIHLMENLEDEEVESGVVTMSAGNFGRTFSYVTRQKGIPAVIVMPTTVPKDRVEIIEKNKAKVKLVPSKDLMDTVHKLVNDHGMNFIHSFDDPLLFPGYGVLGLEILEQVPKMDMIILGIGGGGMISGVSAALKHINNKIKIIGVEPEGAASMYKSLKEGYPVTLDSVNTIASGLAPPFAGTYTYEHVKKNVDEVVLVSDEQIKQAMKILYNEFKLVIEPSGAAPLAALLFNKVLGGVEVKGLNIVCGLCGGNVSIEDLHKFISNI